MRVEFFRKKIIKHDDYFINVEGNVDVSCVRGKVGSKIDFVVSKFSNGRIDDFLNVSCVRGGFF